MSIKLTQVPQNSTTGENTDPLGYETTYDGQTFFWAPGQTRSFADDGQGIGHAANTSTGPAAGVVEDNLSSKKHRPSDVSRA